MVRCPILSPTAGYCANVTGAGVGDGVGAGVGSGVGDGVGTGVTAGVGLGGGHRFRRFARDQPHKIGRKPQYRHYTYIYCNTNSGVPL